MILAKADGDADSATVYHRQKDRTNALRPESGVKGTGFCEKWPKTGVFIKRFVQQSMNLQSIAGYSSNGLSL